MEEYIVSARKYRPASFDTVVGQKALTETLKNAIKANKLAHAYLFCGPRGVGKTTCARIFAKTINCFTPTAQGEACNHCESCAAFNEQRSFNIFELDAASNNSVENIKALMEQTRIPPQVGKYKVFIIDEVHMLSTAAFNAFLKTLEEPPAHVIFILATTEKHKILPTILSRCQIYDFERMTVQDIVNHLESVAKQEGITYEPEALTIIAEKADGGMRDALSIFDQTASFAQGNITYAKVLEDLNVLDVENYFKMIDFSLENKVSELMLLLNSIVSRGFDYGNISVGLAAHIRNVLMSKDEKTVSLIETSDSLRQRYKEQAAKCPTTFLYKALKLLNQCDINYKQSSNKALLVELTLIQVAQITQPEDADSDASGRSPKSLKTLFKLLTASNRTQTDKQVSVSDKQKAVQPIVSKPKEPTTPVKTEQPKASNNPSRPRLKISDLAVTSKGMGTRSNAAKEEYEELVNTEEQTSTFTDEDLREKWISMCNRMPSNMKAMAMRMKNMKLHITTLPNIEVVVDNQILLTQMNEILARLEVTMAQDLKNKDVKIALRLAKKEELKPILSDREIFAKLLKNNHSLATLKEALKLELS
ncbi:DNA polymerase III subunit gamma/tau [Prevotella nanceiensis]|jgi:DNA polymerase III, subunit gamma and tau|uniref:DNA polymerase III subunit gamma/tau n=1 Tax=Hoylesella nanceiensis TaxID=425941 RepID=UPI001C5E776F|nr:DNA polymerase III subunit gamma/tau [Hoylesella nanceiensis]MBW4834612.1 DNA polymerase III subunit gamma/tau [Hoylesella nanceiensis]